MQNIVKKFENNSKKVLQFGYNLVTISYVTKTCIGVYRLKNKIKENHAMGRYEIDTDDSKVVQIKVVGAVETLLTVWYTVIFRMLNL